MPPEILDATLDPNPKWPAIWKWTYLLVFALGIALVGAAILVNMPDQGVVYYPPLAQTEPPDPVPYFVAILSAYLVGISWYALLVQRKYPQAKSFFLALYTPILAGLALLLHVQFFRAWRKGVETLVHNNPLLKLPDLTDLMVYGALGIVAYEVGLLTILAARKQWKWLGISLLGGLCLLVFVIYLSGG